MAKAHGVRIVLVRSSEAEDPRPLIKRVKDQLGDLILQFWDNEGWMFVVPAVIIIAMVWAIMRMNIGGPMSPTDFLR